MPDSQEQIFEIFEGDQWFARNKARLDEFKPESDLPTKLIELYGIHPTNILEIGAANGFRLDYLRKRYNARAVALEPSESARSDGQSRFPDIRFVKGVAYQMPIKDSFDLIIANFVFHWVDRTHLLRSVAEVDGQLADMGFLIVGDFFPSNFTRVHYHHLKDGPVFTYKQDYAATFLASGLYHRVCLMTGSHSSSSLMACNDESDRKGTWLLQKNLKAHYVEGSRKG